MGWIRKGPLIRFVSFNSLLSLHSIHSISCFPCKRMPKYTQVRNIGKETWSSCVGIEFQLN